MRANFDSFYWSVISVFQVICLDNWNNFMYAVSQLVDPPADPLVSCCHPLYKYSNPFTLPSQVPPTTVHPVLR